MQTKQNVVVFMTDQQNGKTIFHGNVAKTPNMDRFLKQSTHFTQCYTASPHCCPSRASFFSGLYPSEHNVWNNVEVDNAHSKGLYDDVVLFPECLQQNGYHTVFSGKWHVSSHESPADRGFDEVLCEVTTNKGRSKLSNRPSMADWAVYQDKATIDLKEDMDADEFGRILRYGYSKYYQFGNEENPFGDAQTTEKACAYIQEYDFEQPLLMYVGTIGPHDPYCVPQAFLDLYDLDDIVLPPNFEDDMLDKPALYRRTKMQFKLTEAEHKESLRHYLAFVSYEDYLFGQLLDTIEAKGIQDDTTVMYLSDHGDYMGAHGLWAKGLPCFQEAYHVPAVIRGARFPAGAEIDDFVSLVDFAPTILDITKTKHETLSGHSLLPLIKGDEPPALRQATYTQTNGNEVYGIQRSVMTKKWKFVYNTFDFDELYDLEADPLELHNLLPSDEYNQVVYDMSKLMWQFAKRHMDNCICSYIMVSLAQYGPGIILEN